MGRNMQTTIAYKAFDPEWKCRGFQYEIGKSYQHKGKTVLCGSGFHACLVPFDVWSYYPGSRHLARVQMENVNEKRESDSKIVAGKITIEMSLGLPEWIKAQVDTVLDLCKAAKATIAKDKLESAAATGNYGHAAATGEKAIAASIGPNGTAKAEVGGFIILVAYDDDWNPLGVFSSKVGKNGVEAGKTYRLTSEGKLQETEEPA